MKDGREDAFRSGSGVYLVLSEPRVPHVELAEEAVGLGVAALQLREKHLPPDALLSLARELRAVTEGSGTVLIVNDSVDVAVASGADGVHLGQADEAPARAMREGLIVGVSASSVEEARAARTAGANYLGIGPVFATPTKPDAGAPLGTSGLAEIVAAVPDLPHVAIGGIDAANAGRVLRAGADLVAVISCVCHATDPPAALRFLVSEIDRPASRRRAGPGRG